MNMDRNVWGFGGDIGLIRTEAWIVDNQEQSALLKKILLDGDDEALRQLSVELKQDYYGLPSNRSVRIRLFDLSPRELMTSEEQKEFSRKFGNLDVRGGAALQAWPQLYREQIRTLCLLMMDRQYMKNPPLEIMMPEIKTEADVIAIKKMIKEEADNAGLEQGRHYRFGVMAETLRCCQNIEKIVPHCDFISFGTNDLSQEFFGIDRGNLLARSQFSSKNGYDPFKTLGSSVFDLMKDVIAKARRIKSDIEIDVCGAHAEDLSTAVALFDSGIDNISVAPTDRNLCILPIRIGYHRLDRDHPQEDLRLKATEGLQL
ncbi:MAG TPA: putative PEP-binding protein [Micavibrio sp.]